MNTLPAKQEPTSSRGIPVVGGWTADRTTRLAWSAWRVVVWGAKVGGMLLAVGDALMPGPPYVHTGVDNPFGMNIVVDEVSARRAWESCALTGTLLLLGSCPVSALREKAVRYGRVFAVEAPAEIPMLPTAVEVDAYGVALGAITNAAHHSRARVRCIWGTLSDEELRIDIPNDGVGTTSDCHVGVGLSSMRKRGAGIGGMFRVRSVPGRGTRILDRPSLPGSGGR